jgi:beta-glucosidase
MLAPTAKPSPFPKNFVWGVATSAFQIEGAATADGKGPSVWDDFCRRPGVIADHSDGSVACDHFHRLEEDLDLIESLGVDAYRFSVSWPRVQPSGAGAFNAQGLAFYERLVDGLLERGVKPYLTLNHWDLPSALQADGGWAHRDTAQRFVDYASHVAKKLGDRVAAITTHNEPWVIATLGYETGTFAPGLKDRKAAVQASHHLLLSHGLALQALRAQGCKSRLGIVLNLSPNQSATDSDADITKTRIEDGRMVRWYMDPLFKGTYPADVIEFLGVDAPQVAPGDMQNINVPMDFLGVNYYTRQMVSASEPFDVHDSGYEVTDMGWEVYPQGLTELLLRLHNDYPLPPMYIKENGAAFKDVRTGDRVHDEQRREYIAKHIAAVGDAMRQGVRMEGYMVWSLLDNFEWASGYDKRFGIVHVDFETQQRILKDSALWYRDFIQCHKARHGLAAAALATGG